MSSIKQILLVAATLFATLGMAPPAGAAAAAGNSTDPGGDPTSWTLRTANTRYGSGRPQFRYTVNPGDKLKDAITIANSGSASVTLKVYAADGFIATTGDLNIRTADKKSRDLGTWVKPATTTVTIPAGKHAQVPFSLAIPTNAAPGDHVGGIVTELDQGSPTPNAGNGTNQRHWLSIEVRVSGKLTPRLEIEDLELDLTNSSTPFSTDQATVNYTVHNTGNTILNGLQKATVSGAFGLQPRTVDGKPLPHLLPGETWRAHVPVKKIHALLWASGTMTITPVLTDAAASTSTLRPVTASDHSLVSIWSLVLVVVLLLVVAAVAWLFIRLLTRSRRASTRPDNPERSKPDDASALRPSTSSPHR